MIGQEETSSLSCILGRTPSPKWLSSAGRDCPGKWSHRPWRHSKDAEMQHSVMWFSGGSAGLMVRLDDLKGLFQAKQCYDSLEQLFSPQKVHWCSSCWVRLWISLLSWELWQLRNSRGIATSGRHLGQQLLQLLELNLSALWNNSPCSEHSKA